MFLRYFMSAPAVALLALLATATHAGAQSGEIRVEPEIAMAAAPALAKRGHGRARHSRAIGLPPPSQAELGQIEAPRRGKPPQIGFGRAIAALAEGAGGALEWEVVDGVSVAALTITSPGAEALRLGLEVKAIPPAAVFRFHDQAGEALFEVSGEEILAVLAANAAAGEKGRDGRTWWSPVIESESAVMEVELPLGASPGDVRFSVPRVSHLVASAKTGFVAKAAAACHNDATCQLATWSAQMNAISRMVFSVGGSSYVCTGTLLADTDASTTIPYFLTANHCINTLPAAQSLVNFWFYRSTACNSGVPGAYVQQAAGSGTQLLHNSTATDVSFLRLGNTPPAGTTYAGWKATPGLALGSAITALHQPAGDLLKISTGSVAGYLVCSPPDSNGQFGCSNSSAASSRFYEVGWTSGVTQGGSSGSALFDSGKYVVGQLYGGGSSCSTPGNTDIYGRFDVSYASGGLATFLSPVAPPTMHLLNVTRLGTSSSGTITSSPAGINCPGTCSASFVEGTTVTLVAAATGGVSTFAGWGGACTGSGARTGSSCPITLGAPASASATFNVDNGVAVSPGQLIFGSTQSTQAVTFTNNTGAKVTFAQATTSSARFGQSNNCGEVAAGASCTAQVTYYPANTGADSATIVLTSNAFAGSHGAALYANHAEKPRLVNISTRMQSLTGSDVLIGGFIIQGSSPKTVVVRARGPSLAQFGIYNNLADPQLQIFSGTTQIAYNNNWAQASNLAALQASGFAPSVAAEAAVILTLQPGAYTGVISGVGGGTGVAIIEVFEVDHPEFPLSNISTRGQVRTGADSMIGGFVIQGNAPRTVVVRARGPSLASAGVPGVLGNPQLQLVRSADGAAIATNDNWGTASNAAQLQASGFAPSDPLEAAVLVTLPPGAYSAVVTGVGGATGVGIVEVFAQ